MDLEDYIKKGTLKEKDIGVCVKQIAKHHIESFNLLYEYGLQNICKYLNAMEIIQSGNMKIDIDGELQQSAQIKLPFKSMKIWFESLSIGVPMKEQTELGTDHRLFPSECRISQKTYQGSFWGVVCRQLDNGEIEKQDISLGEIPIMVGSKRCHLCGLSPDQLVNMHEDAGEFGGYFILNGIEKLIRMLIVQKRNYPIGFIRSGFVNRGPGFTPIAVMMKCLRNDLFAKTITLHYVNDGNVILRLLHRKQEFLIPLIIILKGLVKTTDLQIYNKIVKGYRGKSNISDRVEVMLQSKKNMSLDNQKDCLRYLGSNFRVVLGILNPETSDKEAGEIFLREQICVHLDKNIDKFNILCHMVHKLYQLSSKEVNPDNLDSLINQEVLLSGHLYINILREKIEELLLGIRQKIFKDAKKGTDLIKFREMSYLKRAIELQTSIGKKLEYFLATGNLRSQTGLDLMQAKGYSIIADKINFMRFVSHFRSIHRGTYFAEMKTTSVRKLLPENWGFICPIHTPDGHPCGLLNHIAMSCKPLTRPCQKSKYANLIQICTNFGMCPLSNDFDLIYPAEYYTVILDGKIIGYVEPLLVNQFLTNLRALKISQDKTNLISKYLEIGFIPQVNYEPAPQSPGVFLFTNEARMVRPVRHLGFEKIEWISPFEQNYLSIACLDCDIRTETTHQELNSRMMLSILGAQIPFLEYNQSPRDIYQCQMSKQTMSIAFHNEPWRFDNKSYRLSSMQRPVVRTVDYDKFGFNDYPQGNNAVVAVLGYTGYDMEDGMIITKDVKERGFMNGTIWKVQQFEVNPNEGNKRMSRFKLLCASNAKNTENGVDIDGIPKIGTEIVKDSLEFATFDTNKNEIKKFFHKDQEKSRLQQAAIIQNENNLNDIKVIYKLRYSRTPIIGDKFSSRHGQKGVLSMLWPQIDMPFTESGITPDVLINPHAFPSRMTIGMLIESMAGKAGSLNGELQQIDSFTTYPESVISYFGKQLVAHGFSYLGTEQMYSGISGERMPADLYLGVVYYQRLRHMVSDKVQARATGPIDILTQQPIKGRKRHGGIRVGEMERDALIAHGMAFAVNDRLMNVSDLSEGVVCSKCGGILAAFHKQPLNYCQKCGETGVIVKMPFVVRYLANELAAMKIKLCFRLTQ